MDTSSACGSPYTTFEPFTFYPASEDWGVTPLTVTITAGLEKVAATATTAASGTHASDGSVVTGSGATATATSKTSNAGVSLIANSVGALGMFGLVAVVVMQ